MTTPNIIIANWKMNLTERTATELLTSIAGIPQHVRDSLRMSIAPSACFVPLVRQMVPWITICAQDVSAFDYGAYTGDISAQMMASMGVTMSLIGHSERRYIYHENNAAIHDKLRHCARHNITPIVCVGETLEERQAGDVKSVILRQIDVLEKYSNPFMIAYEPVWAIGTGETATPDMVDRVHTFIQKSVGPDVPILYGGSVKADTIDSILRIPTVHGALVGGASLKSDEFIELVSKVAGYLDKTT